MSFHFIRSERRWLSQNDSSLLDDLQNNVSIEDLSSKYNKSPAVIRGRILHLALLMINEVGFGIQTVSNMTNIPIEDLQVYSDLMDHRRSNLISKL